MGYPGGKSGPGVFQRLINEIPAHDVYVAGFAGRDAIAQNKRPAARTVLIDLDPAPLDWWAKDPRPGFELHECSAVDWLRVTFGLTRRSGTGPAESAAEYSGWFVFLDPPYLMSTRSSGRIYRHELDQAGHCELLELVKRLPCSVMLCGYPSPLYAAELEGVDGWRWFDYWATARNGERRRERAWCNYPRPAVLHDSRFVGGDKRERERVRRRIRRLAANLRALSEHERQAVLDAVATLQAGPLDLAAVAAVAAGSVAAGSGG